MMKSKKQIAEEFSQKPAALVFPGVPKQIEKGICPLCGEEINVKDFRDELSKKEYEISGVCQKCQDAIWGNPQVAS